MSRDAKEVDSEKGSVQPSVDVEEARFEKGLEAQGILVPKSGFLHKVSIITNDSIHLLIRDTQLWSAVLYIDRFGVEVRGIERVRPEDRTALSAWDVWDSATM